MDYVTVSDEELNKYTIEQLKELCRNLEIKGFSGKRIAVLRNFILESPNWINRIQSREEVSGKVFGEVSGEVSGTPVKETIKSEDKLSKNTSIVSSNHEQLGEIQNDIWIQEEALTKNDDLNKFTKDALLKIYNDTSYTYKIPSLTTTWNSKTKSVILAKVLELIDEGYEVLPPKIPNTGTIPRIAALTPVKISFGGAFSSVHKEFGIVKSQDSDGVLHIQIYNTQHVSGGKLIPGGGPRPSSSIFRIFNKLSPKIYKAKPVPDENVWKFCSTGPKPFKDIGCWIPWDQNFDELYEEEHYLGD